jgi:chromosomal replication initiation ATPase DnaA
MSLDIPSIQYAQKLLHKGYGFQNAARIARINETDLRAFVGAVRKRAVPVPVSVEVAPRSGRSLSHKRAQNTRHLTTLSRAIVEAVASRFGMTAADLIGPRRTREYAYARHMAMAEVRAARCLSLPAIGRMFGGRDHTTVIHGIRCHQERAAWCDVLSVFADVDAAQPDLFARAA